MNLSDEFFKLFDIKKVEYREPARVEDNNGDLCEWYIEYDYPCIEPVFFDLLNLYEVQYRGREVNCPLKSYNLKLCLMQSLIDLYNVIEDKLKEELKRDIQNIFEDYYSDSQYS